MRSAIIDREIFNNSWATKIEKKLSRDIIKFKLVVLYPEAKIITLLISITNISPENGIGVRRHSKLPPTITKF